MTEKERMYRILYDTLVLLCVVALLLFVCRIWPILLLVLLCIVIAMARLVFLSPKQVCVAEDKPESGKLSDVTEQGVRTLAYAVILRRITELVTQKYPNASWVWESPLALQQIEFGGTVSILLNRAGGYRRAKVMIHNLQVVGFEFEMPMLPGSCVSDEKEPGTMHSQGKEKEALQKENVQKDKAVQRERETEMQTGKKNDPEPDPMKENYELIAFEWVEANIIRLNDQCNEAIGNGLTDLLITTEQLPVPESWENIRKELLRTGLEEVVCCKEGITINLLQ